MSIRRSVSIIAIVSVCALLTACGSSNKAEPATPPTSPQPAVSIAEIPADAEPPSSTASAPALRTLFPHVRADLQAKVVEFDARVTPLLIPDPQAPLFFLEVLVCTPDTREHETLLIADAKPRHVHAALLAIGLEPGSPASWKLEPAQPDGTPRRLVAVPPTGSPVQVRFVLVDPVKQTPAREVDPLTWVIHASDVLANKPNPCTLQDQLAARAESQFLFAGSTLGQLRPNEPPVYHADGTGQLIGLHAFGSEVVAIRTVMNPDAQTETPEWVADLRRGVIPPPGTPVIVRISPSRSTAD